jgi:hypothetical protein
MKVDIAITHSDGTVQPGRQHEGPLDLPIVGGTVVQCRIDRSFTLLIDVDVVASWLLRIESDIDLRSPSGPPEVIRLHEGTTPGDVNRLVNDLLHRRVESAHVAADGILAVEFDESTALAVPVDEHYEPWQLTGPGNETIVSGPGGGICIFEPRR